MPGALLNDGWLHSIGGHFTHSLSYLLIYVFTYLLTYLFTRILTRVVGQKFLDVFQTEVQCRLAVFAVSSLNSCHNSDHFRQEFFVRHTGLSHDLQYEKKVCDRLINSAP